MNRLSHRRSKLLAGTRSPRTFGPMRAYHAFVASAALLILAVGATDFLHGGWDAVAGGLAADWTPRAADWVRNSG
jgi:hypothetical protein